jgi:hypothetical protein
VLHDPKALEEYVHKHVFLKINAEQRWYLTQFFTVLFSDGFESGDFSAWNGTAQTGTTVSVVNSRAHHGTYSMQVANADAAFDLGAAYVSATGSEYYSRCYVMFVDSLPTASGSHVTIGPRFTSSGGLNYDVAQPCFRFSTNKWGIHYYGTGGHAQLWEAGTSTVTTNVWYCLELHIVSADSGTLELWVDGTLKVSSSPIDTNTRAIAYAAVGVYLRVAESSAKTFAFDCAVIADVHIGPEGTLKTVADSLFSSDTVRRSKPALAVADSVAASDTLLRNKQLAAADLAGLSDAVYRNKPTLTLADAVGSSDSLLRSKPLLPLTDILQIADSLSLAKLLSIAESMNLAEAIRALKTLHLPDTVTLADASATPSRVLRALDSAGLADNATVNKTLQLSDEVALVEVVEAGTGGAKKTRLFLVFGDLAVELAG